MSRFLLALVLLLSLAGCRNSDGADGTQYGDKPNYGVKPGATTPNAPGTTQTGSDGITEQDLVGTWRLSAFIPADEVARLSDDPFPPGTEVEATIEGTIDYLPSGEYDAQLDLTYRVRTNGQEVPLRFVLNSQGDWDLSGDVLNEVNASESIAPADALTAEAISGDPGFAESLVSAPGEESASRIVSFSPSSIELQEFGSGLQLTLRR